MKSSFVVVRIWDTLSRLGIHQATYSPSLQKQVILSNRISFTFLPLISVFFFITLLVNKSLIRAGITAFAMGIFLMVLFMNWKGKIHLSRVIMSFIFPIILMAITLLSKMYGPEIIPMVEYVEHRFLLLITLCIPLLLLDPLENRALYWSSLAFNFISLLFLDVFYKLCGVDVVELNPGNPLVADYYLLNLYDKIVAIILIASQIYLRNVNRFFEDRLIENQKELSKSHQELIVLNEELQQQQEEILTQREFLEQRNQELSQLNKKLERNEVEMIKTMDILKSRESQIKEQNSQLRQRDLKITNSIKAALTIQQSILPEDIRMEKNFEDFFVIYQPRDLVSGDFYWINSFRGKIFLAAIDCTGHGVPGAFMSLIGNSLLNTIIKDWRFDNPSQILEQMHAEVQQMLRQKVTGNNYGMDMALIRIENMMYNQKKVVFSGAKSDLYYLEKGGEEVKTLKGTRRAIGGIQNESLTFINQALVLSPGSLLYLGSDGFVDQNNIRRKKFGQKSFLKLIHEVAEEPLALQRVALENKLLEHMKDSEQRDDILMLGLRL